MWSRMLLLNLLTLAAIAQSGCGASTSNPQAQDKASSPAPVATADHDGWWCAEHGIPEDRCAQCSAQVAAECKSKGDWCSQHDRPDSQCFVCHPEQAKQFAALYEAKFGKAPPPRDDEGMN